MGSCCSIQDDESVPRRSSARKPAPLPDSRPIVINTAVVVDRNRGRGQRGGRNVQNDLEMSCYGEFTCSHCGRFWRSILSWRNTYQICKDCNSRVYPRNQREVRPSDVRRSDGYDKEHSSDLCQRCKQLGRYCGNYNKGSNAQVKRRYNHVNKRY
ncbi:uncharacterized protein LOC142980845 [Anticarsia gemmatalis]|uniref:uncharacterized protein LOC142980845 n=1 Tax=Anticarsia gemmatalis TaxID=129554 RepID=UPI003F7704BC